MSLSNTPCRNDAIGNNATSIFDFTFQIVENSDLLVIQRDLDGNETTLILNTDYSVDYTLYDDGGSITLIAGNLPTNYALMIRRNSPIQQETDIRNQGAYFPETIEDALDEAAMIDQQQEEEISRSLRLSETESTEFDAVLPYGVTENEDCVIAIAPNGLGFVYGPTIATIAGAAAAGAASAASAAAAAASDAEAVAAAVQATQSAADAAANLELIEAIVLNLPDFSVCDTSTGNVIENLPAANSGGPILAFINKSFGSDYNVVVNAAAGDNIMGAPTDYVTPGEARWYYPDGINTWFLVN